MTIIKYSTPNAIALELTISSQARFRQREQAQQQSSENNTTPPLGTMAAVEQPRSRDELRQIGTGIRIKEEVIGASYERIGFYEKLAQRKADAGKPLTSPDPRIAREREFIARESAELNALKASLGPQALQMARDATPKNYRTDLANAGRYAPGSEPNRVARPGSGYTGVKGAEGDPRNMIINGKQYNVSARSLSQAEISDRELQSQARRTPGIYRLSTGDVVVSSQGDGTIRTNRGLVTVRSPTYTRLDGRPGYNEPKVVTGFNLFDPRTREALRSSASDYRTAGELYGASRASYAPQQLKNADATTTNNGYYSSGNGSSGNRDLVAGASKEFQTVESPRLQAVRRVSDFVSRYQEGFQERTARLDRALSRASGGKGVPYEERSFGGKAAQISVGIVGLPIYGPAVYADATFLAGQKSFLYTGALMTPETKQAALQEIKESRAVFKEVYTDPRTYAYALTGGLLKGYVNYNVAKNTPYSITTKPYSVIADTPRVSPGRVSATGDLVTTATVKYRYGPGKLFSRSEEVPVRGNFIFEGSRQLAGSTPRVIGEVQTQAAISIPRTRVGVYLSRFNQFKGFYRETAYTDLFSSQTFKAVYRPRSGALSLIDNQGKTAVFSKPGRGVTPKGLDGDLLTSPVRSGTFVKNRFGLFIAQESSNSRGLSYPNQYLSRRVIGRDTFIQAYLDAKATGGKIDFMTAFKFRRLGARINEGERVAVNPSERTVTTQKAGGVDSSIAKAGFNDLRAAGFFRQETLRTGLRLNTQKYPLFPRGRRGQTQITQSKAREIFKDNIRYLRSSPDFLRTPRSPRLAGLPSPSFRSSSRAGVSITPIVNIKSDQNIVSREALATRPEFDTGSIVVSKPRIETIPRQDTQPRITTVQRLSSITRLPTTLQLTGRPPPPPPRIRVPPPPFGLPLLPRGRGAGSTSKSDGGGERAYTPSLYAIGLGIEGAPSKASVFSGLGVRPIPKGRKRRGGRL